MIGNLLKSVLLCTSLACTSVAVSKADAPLNNYNITSLEKSYSVYYDDYLTGLLFYNTEFDQNVLSSSTWTYNNGHYYKTYAYDFHAKSWGGGDSNFSQNLTTYNLFNLPTYEDGYATGDDYSYDFQLALNIDTGYHRCYFMAVVHNTLFNYDNTAYQIEKFASVWQFDNTALSGKFYAGSNEYSFSQVSNLELWYDARLDYSCSATGGTITTTNNRYQILFSGYFTDVYTLYASSFHMEWLLPSIDDGNTIYQDAYKTGYREGWNAGNDKGFNDGYQSGLNISQNASFMSLFNSIADTPLRFLYGLFNFDLFGVSMLVIILSLLTFLVVFAIVKKVWKQSMGNVSYRFFVCLFDALLIYIVLVNFVGWSGGYVDILAGTTTADWTNSYFGFSSLQFMMEDLNNSFKNSGSLSMSELTSAMSDLINTITFGVPKIIGWIQGGKINALDIFNLVLNLFAQPILLVVHSFRILGVLLWYFFLLLGALLKAFSGSYNVPLNDPLDWHSVVSEYNSFAPIV